MATSGGVAAVRDEEMATAGCAAERSGRGLVLGTVGLVCAALTEAPQWPPSHALIQPSLFACADAAPRAELASASAVLAKARSSVRPWEWGTFVAAAGDCTATGLAGFDRAWIVVVITAAITAVAGLATGRRIGVHEVAAKAETACHAVAIACGTSPIGGGRVDR
jgi:hypothetical protein